MNNTVKAIIVLLAIATSACGTREQRLNQEWQSQQYQVMQAKAQQARQSEMTIRGIITKSNIAPVSLQGGDAFNSYNSF